MEEYIEIRGARVNNLKNVSLDIPRNKIIAVTGVSGSGKSSLTFDTLYAEGQRRYVESLSAYARQYTGRMRKPECDSIKGLPPAIAIQQRTISRNPRSTVGTSTEIYEYLRLLYSRIGRTYSPISGEEVKVHTAQDVLNQVMRYSRGTKFAILSPLDFGKDASVKKKLNIYVQNGYSRIWHNGMFHRIEEILDDEKSIGSLSLDDVYLLIDRMSVDDSDSVVSRLNDSVETAFYEGRDRCRLIIMPSNICYDFSESYETDGMKFEKPNTGMFSFNSPVGACPVCEGFGKVIGIDEKLVVPDTSLSVHGGCVQCWHGEKMGLWRDEFCRRAAKNKFPIFEPYYNLTRAQKNMLWHGLPSEDNLPIEERVCIDSFFNMVDRNQYKIQYRVLKSRYRGKTVCPECRGTRLKKEASWVKIGGKSIVELVEMNISSLRTWFSNLYLEEHDKQVAQRLLTEINSRLKFLDDVGLGYLTLNRSSNTLSGGESQRISLTTSIGSPLTGSVYILDEPSIGLHSCDTHRLIDVLKELKNEGNTIVVVEHDEDIMRSADHLIDVGPEAGIGGGEIVYEGRTNDEALLAQSAAKSHTAAYLCGIDKIDIPRSRRSWNMSVDIKGARLNNLRGINVSFPLNVLCVVTGVSGSGKSSLVKGILYPSLRRHFNEECEPPGEYSSLEGDWKYLERVEFVDQDPIGKSSRSNPATYLKVYDAIRQLFADQPLSKQLGFTPQYFSFNADGGRCEECKGAGTITIEMQFMADLVLECEACHGKRFKHDILDVMYHGKNIDDVLNLTVSEAITFFDTYGEKNIARRLKPLEDVGLGYIKLGQKSSTLSGGENQRVKLAYFIGQENYSPTLFIFDEPTTGLHFHDINNLLRSFYTLIDKGHSIIIIEHNLDIIKCADYIIDLGPGGGDKGGALVCCGTPEEVAKCPNSITGKFLSKKLDT